MPALAPTRSPKQASADIFDHIEDADNRKRRQGRIAYRSGSAGTKTAPKT